MSSTFWGAPLARRLLISSFLVGIGLVSKCFAQNYAESLRYFSFNPRLMYPHHYGYPYHYGHVIDYTGFTPYSYPGYWTRYPVNRSEFQLFRPQDNVLMGNAPWTCLPGGQNPQIAQTIPGLPELVWGISEILNQLLQKNREVFLGEYRLPEKTRSDEKRETPLQDSTENLDKDSFQKKLDEVKEGISHHPDRAIMEAGGATGAKLLRGRDGKFAFVAKSLAAPKVNLAHRTVQRHLPKNFDDFSYSALNELFVPQLAKILDLPDGLVPSSREVDLTLEKGKPARYVLIDFKNGKENFARKTRATTRKTLPERFDEPMERLGELQNRKEVTDAALFSVLIGNVDLHSENILINKNEDKTGPLGLTLIDFGLTMPIKNPEKKSEKHFVPVFRHLKGIELDQETLHKFVEKISNRDTVQKIEKTLSETYRDVDPGTREKIKSALEERVAYLQRISKNQNVTFDQLVEPLNRRKPGTY